MRSWIARAIAFWQADEGGWPTAIVLVAIVAFIIAVT